MSEPRPADEGRRRRQPHGLYAYVEGNRLDAIASDLERRLEELVMDGSWVCPSITVVNQRDGTGADASWDLGLYLRLPDGWRDDVSWFRDLEDIVIFIVNLPLDLRRPFVFGMANGETGTTDDVCHVDPDNLDLEWIKESFLGE